MGPSAGLKDPSSCPAAHADSLAQPQPQPGGSDGLGLGGCQASFFFFFFTAPQEFLTHCQDGEDSSALSLNSAVLPSWGQLTPLSSSLGYLPLGSFEQTCLSQNQTRCSQENPH